jgi:peptide/nickel transport system substrate-binding protein
MRLARLSCAGAVALILLSTAGCRRESRRDRAGTNTLTILYPGDERIMGPDYDMPAKFLMFQPLVTFDEHGDVVGALARSWQHSRDYRTWTVHLRSDVRWHDGVSFTAQDVAFTHQLWAHPAVHAAAPGARTVRVLDDSTLTIRYRRPQGSLSTWDVYYPRHLLEGLDPATYYEWAFWIRPIGTGPYRYVRHVPKTMIELEANPNFYRGRPRIGRLVLRSGSHELTELLSGNVDVMAYAERTLLPRLRGSERFAVYYHLWPDVSWLEAIYWNHRDPILADAPVRRALTLAINRVELRRLLELPDDLAIVDGMFSGRQYWRRELPEPLPYDPDEARQLLDEAGWRDRDGDGVRERGGLELRFTALVGSGGRDWDEGGGGSAAIYVQEALRRVGVRMEVLTVEPAVVRRRLSSGNFQAVIGQFYNNWAGDFRWWGANGWTGFANPRALALFDSLQVVADPEQRDAIFRAMMPIFREDVPVTLLFPQVQTVIASKRVHGLVNPFRSDPVMSAEYLWIE